MPSSTFRRPNDSEGIDAIDNAIAGLKSGKDVESQASAFSDLSQQAVRHLRERWLELDPGTRRSLVREMILLRSDITKDFERALLVALDDPEQEVRLLAVDGLESFESVDVPLALCAHLPSDPAPRVREAIARVMGKPEWQLLLAERPDDPAARLHDALMERAIEDEAFFVRCEALASAAWYDDDRLPDLIRELYDAGDTESRVYAVRAMGRQASRGWVPKLIESMQSPDEELRQEAAGAARYLFDRRLVPFLMEIALDDEREVRLAAIASLGETAGEDARQALRQLAESGDEEIAEAADEALANARLIDNVDPLGL